MPPTEQTRWFAEEVKPCEPALRAYLMRRFPSLPDHDDLVQESYIRIMRAKEKGPITYAKAFLFTAARNLAIDFVRRRRSGPHEALSELEQVTALEEPAGVVEALDHQQRLDMLIDAVMELPERCRQVMMLRHLDGLDFDEIGRRLGMSPLTAKVHAVKGLKECIGYFRRHGMLQNGQTENRRVS